MNVNTSKYTKFENIWSVFVPISFFFTQYQYGIGNINITFSFLYAILCFFMFKRNKIYWPLVLYTLWLVIHVSLAVLRGVAPFTYQFIALVSLWCICTFSVIIIAQHVNMERIYKIWQVLGVIVCVAIIAQSIMIYGFGQRVSVIALLPPTYGDNQININWLIDHSRPVSFFTEPSAEITFLAPLLFISLNKNKLFFSVFVTLCMLLTTSTGGIIALFIIWGSYLYYSKAPKIVKKIAFVLMLFISFFLLVLPVFDATIDKLIFELSGESNNLFSRVYGGWLLYANLDISSQIFGISHYDLSTFIREHPQYYPFVSQSRLAVGANFFFNTAQRIFLQTGLIGGYLYYRMLYNIYKNTSNMVKPYLLYVIAAMFFEFNFYNNNMFMLQYTVILAYLNWDKQKTGISFNKE